MSTAVLETEEAQREVYVDPDPSHWGAESHRGAGLAILVPVLRRPHRVKPLLESIEATAPDASVVFICDPGDVTEHQAVYQAGRIPVIFAGNYAQKINYALLLTSEPLIFLGADDLNFHSGWLESAKRKLSPPVGVVGTQDLGNPRVLAGDHSTHPLVARRYAELGTIDEPGKLLHEGYEHNFCDTELVETAKSRGAWAFAEDSIVEHCHPFWGKSEPDEVYEKGQAGFRRDRRIFHYRRRLWTT